jgi:ABC-type Fe3+/spermidine/putrescine transport system ATPase subunit
VGSLRLENIGRRFGLSVAVEGVNLDVADGEFVTLLGPSGCGKTTTLRMVAGFIAPDTGDIWFNGQRINDVPPHKRNTAMVFQSYALFPHMTVAQNVAFGLKMRKLPAEEQARRVGEALEMVSLGGLEKRRPGELSGGQQQRVALARAIATRPDILLFDEPLSNLDARLRDKVKVEIRDLQRRLGITALYVTHDQAEALAISDRVVVMNRGRIEQVGNPDTIYRSPASSFVAEFVGAANIVGGESRGGGIFDTAAGTLTSADKSIPAGSSVKLSWRPEDMRIAAPGATPAIAHAKVVSSVFHGNLIELVVDAGGQLLRVQAANDLAIRVGETLAFTIAPDRIRVVD